MRAEGGARVALAPAVHTERGQDLQRLVRVAVTEEGRGDTDGRQPQLQAKPEHLERLPGHHHLVHARHGAIFVQATGEQVLGLRAELGEQAAGRDLGRERVAIPRPADQAGHVRRAVNGDGIEVVVVVRDDRAAEVQVAVDPTQLVLAGSLSEREGQLFHGLVAALGQQLQDVAARRRDQVGPRLQLLHHGAGREAEREFQGLCQVEQGVQDDLAPAVHDRLPLALEALGDDRVSVALGEVARARARAEAPEEALQRVRTRVGVRPLVFLERGEALGVGHGRFAVGLHAPHLPVVLGPDIQVQRRLGLAPVALHHGTDQRVAAGGHALDGQHGDAVVAGLAPELRARGFVIRVIWIQAGLEIDGRERNLPNTHEALLL